MRSGLDKPIRVCRLANSEFFVRHHLQYQIESQLSEGLDVHLVYPNESPEGLTSYFSGAKHHFLPFARKPNPIVDFFSFFALLRLLRRERMDILHTVTPKAGLLGAVVGKLIGVPIRIHTFTGQVWATKSGFFRFCLKRIDWLIIKLNTKCFADSQSQINFLIEEKVALPGEVEVIGAGSLSGFDSEKLNPEKYIDQRKSIRGKFGFHDDDFVVNYTGRLNRDKGVLDLVLAILAKETSTDVKLLLVGPLDGNDSFKKELDMLCHEGRSRIVVVGYQPDPAPYFAASDLFAMPSYREGFGGVLIEAAMMGLPAIATRIPGPIDAVQDGTTGTLVQPGNIQELVCAIKNYASNSKLSVEAAQQARHRAVNLFDFRVINRKLIATYRVLFEKVSADY